MIVQNTEGNKFNYLTQLCIINKYSKVKLNVYMGGGCFRELVTIVKSIIAAIDTVRTTVVGGQLVGRD